MHELVVRNGRIVSADFLFDGDIGIDSGSISRIGRHLEGERAIDASGKYVIPGVIDSHVHFREPGAGDKEDWRTGSSAAAAGGVSTVLEMPNTHPPTVTLELLEEKRSNFASKSIVDYGFHFGASTSNIEELRRIDNVASIKFYLGSTTGSLLVESNAVLYEQLKVVAERGMIASTHAESEQIIREETERLKNSTLDPEAYADARPPRAAVEATKSIISISKMAKNRLHLCHVTSGQELEIISKEKAGHPITAEVTPHHLILTREDYGELGTYAKTNPPLRSKEDREALWRGLADGTIDLIASDHAPHTRESKEADIWTAPAGIPGVETMLPLMLNEVNKGRLELGLLTRLLSLNPARIYGIRNKGQIAEGFDADLVIVDMKEKRKVSADLLHSKCGWSPYEGRELAGWPVTTLVRGNLAYEEGETMKTNGREVSYG